MAINRDKILREAEKLVQKGKIEQAIREYEKLLKANPNEANTINRVGDLYGRIGQVDKAVELYEKIAKHFTQDGFTTKAIAILKKINRLAPQRLDIFEQLAELYIQQGLVVEAKNQYQILADWYARNEDHGRAVEAHRKLVQLDPGNHVAHLRLADQLLECNKADEAIEVYDRLGRMLLERDKLDEAERLYRHALEKNPPSGDLFAPLCAALLEAGRTTTAREFLDGALKRSPENAELRLLDTRLLLAMGEADKALERAERALDDDPDNDELKLLTGRCMLAVGEAVRARDLLIPVAEHSMSAGNFGRAQQICREMLQSVSHDPMVLTASLRAFGPSGDSEMNFTLKAALADTHFRTGQVDLARAAYLELQRIDPSNDMFRQRLAKLDSPDADRLIDEAGVPEELTFDEVELDSTVAAPQLVPTHVEAMAPVPAADFDPHERLAEASVFAKYGLHDKAAHHLESIVGAFPDVIEARQKLVDLYIEQGQVGQAAAIAAPLVEHYTEQGETDALDALLAAVPALSGDAPALMAVDEDLLVEEQIPVDEDLVVEIEEDVLEDAPAFMEDDQEGVAEEQVQFEAEALEDQGAEYTEGSSWEYDDLQDIGEAADVEYAGFDDEDGGGSAAEWGGGADDGTKVIDLEPAVESDAVGAEAAFDDFDAQMPAEVTTDEMLEIDEELVPDDLEDEVTVVEELLDPEELAASAAGFEDDAGLDDAGPEDVGFEDVGLEDVGLEDVGFEDSSLQDSSLDDASFGEASFEEIIEVEPLEPDSVIEESEAPFEPSFEPELSFEPEPEPEPEPLLAQAVPRRAPQPDASQNAIMELDALEQAVLKELSTKGRRTDAAPARPAPVEPPVMQDAPAEPPAPVAAVEETLAGPGSAELGRIDHYLQQEMYDDALRELGRLEVAFPDDPEIARRRLQLKTKGVLLEEVPLAGADEQPEDLFADEEEFFDLARELEEELAEEEAMVEEATGKHEGEAELEEVFREFQKGVSEQLSEEDSDTHFNLGIAYREMGLLPEAIREFQIASRGEAYFIECCSMIAVCYVEQGISDQAAGWYRKALTAPDLTPEAKLALRYDLASALESAGDVGEAAEVFTEIATDDPAFRDVSNRLDQLS